MTSGMIFLNFLKKETLQNLKSSSFLGFLGIWFLFLTPAYHTTGMEHITSAKTELRVIFIMTGLLVSIYFAFLVSLKFTKEFENRTINILLTSPLSRDRIFIGKALSILILFPVLLAVMIVPLGISSTINGKILAVEMSMVFYRILLLFFYLVSIVLFFMVISIYVRKSAVVMTIAALYIFFTQTIIGNFAFIYDNTPGPTPNYIVTFLLPSSLYAVGLEMTAYLIVDKTLLLIQMIFILIFFLIGILSFRRVQTSA